MATRSHGIQARTESAHHSPLAPIAINFAARNLAATNLKIDRSFICQLEGHDKTRRLVQAMIEAGHSLGLSVTAEGVETEAQVQILEELGCDLAQGHLWSPAHLAQEIGDWLAAAEKSPGVLSAAADNTQRPRPDPGRLTGPEGLSTRTATALPTTVCTPTALPTCANGPAANRS